MHSKRTIVAIGGAKGVGKTAVIEKIASTLTDFVTISTGKILQEMSLKRFNKDFLSLDKTHKQVIRRQYVQKIFDINKNLLLDIHFGEFEDSGYPCVVPKKLIKTITHFILITAYPQEIKERRRSEGKRRRLDVTSICLNLFGEKLLFEKLTKDRGVKSISVINKNINQVAKRIINFIQN